MKKTCMKYLFAMGTCLAVFACSGHDSAVARLDAAGVLVAENPDSAAAVLCGIDPADLRSSALAARRALLYSEALDRCRILVDDDSLSSVALKYYAKHGSDRERAKAYYYHACVCENAGHLEEAVKNLVVASGCGAVSEDRYLGGLVNESFGRLYMAQLHLGEAEAYYEKALACYRDCGKKLNVALCRTKLAKIAALRDDDSEALAQYGKALDLLREVGDTVRILQVNGTVAGLELRHTQRIDAAKRKLRDGYRLYNDNRIPREDMSLWCVLYINDRDLDSARRMAQDILRDRTLETGKRAATLFLLKDIEKRDRNYKMVAHYAEAYIRCIDSVYAAEQRQQIQQLERRYKNELLQANNDKLRQRNTYLIITGTLGFFLLLFISGAVLRQRKKLIERQRLRLAHYSKFIDSLKGSYGDMKARYEILVRQQDREDEASARILSTFKNRLEGLKLLIDNAYLYERKPAQFYEEFKKYVIINPNTQYAFSDIQYVVNKTCFGVIDYLKENYPELTAFDLDLCSLLCFGFSQNGIRMIYEHKNAYSIYNKRSKLRKKLGLQPGEHIEHFLRELTVKLEKRQKRETE